METPVNHRIRRELARQSHFTKVELICVIVILGILVLLAWR